MIVSLAPMGYRFATTADSTAQPSTARPSHSAGVSGSRQVAAAQPTTTARATMSTSRGVGAKAPPQAIAVSTSAPAAIAAPSVPRTATCLEPTHQLLKRCGALPHARLLHGRQPCIAHRRRRMAERQLQPAGQGGQGR